MKYNKYILLIIKVVIYAKIFAILDQLSILRWDSAYKNVLLNSYNETLLTSLLQITLLSWSFIYFSRIFQDYNLTIKILDICIPFKTTLLIKPLALLIQKMSRICHK